MQADISQVVADVIKKLKEAVASKDAMVSFDFTGANPQFAPVIQRLLMERGFVSFIALSSGEAQIERVYVDLVRRRAKTKVPVGVKQNDAK